MTRRGWLGLAALAPAAARVRVTGLETFVVKVNRRGNWLLVRLRTSAGVTGLGEASHGGNDARAAAHLRDFAEALRGRSIFDIEWLRRLNLPGAQGRAAAVARSAVEQALWDIQGQMLGVPCYQLFGGSLHERIRNYANINRSTEERTPAGFARTAQAAMEAGFDAVKLAPWDGGVPFETGIQCVEAVRRVIGPDRALLVDGHSHFDLARGLDLVARMEPLRLFWLEEVTPPEHLPAINRAARMPTAGGESIYGVAAYYRYLAAGSVDIAMPDVKYCGGMLEMKKIAAVAEGAGLPVAPHGPASPVGNIAAAHVCAGLPNFQILEFSFGEVPWREELIEPPERLIQGHLALSARPGLGLKLNEKTAARYRAG